MSLFVQLNASLTVPGVCKELRREIESNIPIKVLVNVTKKKEIKSNIFFSVKLISFH